VNTRRAPGGILGNHTEDELAQFPARRLPANLILPSRDPSPVQPKSSFVPADNGIRLDEYQHPFPSRPQSPQQNPKQFVERRKSRLRMPLPQDRKLLPQSHIFKEQVAAGSDGPSERDEQEPQRARHESVVAETLWFAMQAARPGRPGFL